ncbi:MAG: aminopeptidase [Clostridiales bacterium]|nr:aminopeptidase [Clostridiales bacterium]
MNFIDSIHHIAKGFEFEKGEIVLLHFFGDNRDLDVLDKLAIEIGKSGAVPMKFQQSREFVKDYYSAVDKENLTFPEKYFDVFKIADSVIDICMYPVPAPHKEFPRDKMDEYRQNMMNTMRSIMPDKKYYIQLRVPTKENAAAEGLEFSVYEKAMLDAFNIDYVKLKEKSKEVIKGFEGVKKVEIYTGKDSRLQFDITERPWHRDDGFGDLPCGEVYVAPVEESVNGDIIIPKAFLNGDRLENITLSFENGVLVSSSHQLIIEHASQFPGDSNVFAEFGIGLNENVKDLLGYALIDEKCSETMHIAIGMNDMFGGKNSSPFHMDFIFKPTRVMIDHMEFKL